MQRVRERYSRGAPLQLHRSRAVIKTVRPERLPPLLRDALLAGARPDRDVVKDSWNGTRHNACVAGTRHADDSGETIICRVDFKDFKRNSTRLFQQRIGHLLK